MISRKLEATLFQVPYSTAFHIKGQQPLYWPPDILVFIIDVSVSYKNIIAAWNFDSYWWIANSYPNPPAFDVVLWNVDNPTVWPYPQDYVLRTDQPYYPAPTNIPETTGFPRNPTDETPFVSALHSSFTGVWPPTNVVWVDCCNAAHTLEPGCLVFDTWLRQNGINGFGIRAGDSWLSFANRYVYQSPPPAASYYRNQP